MTKLVRKPLTKEQLLARGKCCKLECQNCPWLYAKKKHWAYNVQTHPLPSWSEAFEYAYNLGLEDGKKSD